MNPFCFGIITLLFIGILSVPSMGAFIYDISSRTEWRDMEFSDISDAFYGELVKFNGTIAGSPGDIVLDGRGDKDGRVWVWRWNSASQCPRGGAFSGVISGLGSLPL